MPESTMITLFTTLRNIAHLLVPIFITIAMLYFIYGGLQYMGAVEKLVGGENGSEKGKQSGKDKMIWGIVGMFVIVSVWGLVRLIGNTLDIQPGTNNVEIPQF